MNFIIGLLVNAGILLALASLLPGIRIKSFGTALLVAFVIGILNATIGLLLRFPLNVLTLGLLSFFVHLIVTAVMIKIADKLFKDFELKGFTPALIIALVSAIAGTIFSLN
jgi:putative membrane protein